MTDNTATPEPKAAYSSQWRDVWVQFSRHKGAVISAGVFGFLVLAVVIGPLVWTLDPTYVDFRNRHVPMSWAHPLGTDHLGRDILARMLFGGKISLAVGIVAMLIALSLGTLIGVLAGYFRKLDNILMRVTDLFLSLPLLPLLLVMMFLFQEPAKAAFGKEMGIFFLIVLAIGVTSWMPTARIVRGDVLALREREFILAARSIGTSDRAMVMRHLLPNILSPIMVSATLGIANAIITESSLSFLGLGFPSDFPTWGGLLNEGRERIDIAAAPVVWPAIAISLVVLSVNYMGDGLRDALDPRIRGR